MQCCPANACPVQQLAALKPLLVRHLGQPPLQPRSKGRVFVHCQAQPSTEATGSFRCTRRWAAFTPVLLSLTAAPALSAEQGLGRYVKRKKLDPLETYVPSVILAKTQLRDAGSVMGVDPKAARNLLRGGAFGGLRDCIRAIGQYAKEEERTSSSDKVAEEVFRDLEAFDFLLFDNARQNKTVPLDEASKKLQKAIDALDRLLATVPKQIVQRAQEVADTVSAGQLDSMSKDLPAPPPSLAERLRDLVPKT